ncbi:hypothetical protein SUGI_0155220 [Cryptomeria japonica]|nr:hypothetical protein SUGI_0155220 [Cryptomeria japonica]
MYNGLKKCLEMGNVVRTVSPGVASSWRSQIWVDYICDVLRQMNEYSIRHIFREANMVPDLLSNHAIDQEIGEIFARDMAAWNGAQAKILDADKNMPQ